MVLGKSLALTHGTAQLPLEDGNMILSRQSEQQGAPPRKRPTYRLSIPCSPIWTSDGTRTTSTDICRSFGDHRSFSWSSRQSNIRAGIFFIRHTRRDFRTQMRWVRPSLREYK